ncbi:hypothetical protein DRN97_00740 [Methanosarcinales archaeon]|nr:MAG: hypothetical protein DRN97_00740 [Methanosarcinales archaeon]
MLRKLSIWVATFLFVLVAFVMHWEFVWAVVFIAGGVILAIGMLYSRYNADKEYMRDPEVALLIGRRSEGVDHKGRRTQRLIR